MFVGEAPGADEDIQGEPFVGRAGQLLTKIIEAIGLRREDVYIANVIKCRPPGNRNPEPDEVEQCEPFLFRQIDTIKPKVIVALGKFAAQALLKTERSDHAAPRPRVQLPRRDPDAHLPSGLPAANSVGEARGVGGHEARPRDAEQRRTAVVAGFSRRRALMPLISVAVPVPFLDLLTYRVPLSLALPPVGARVRVPVGTRVVTGCVVAHDAAASTTATEAQGRPRVLDAEPFLPPPIVELCRWVADYYLAGIGDAIAVAMPPGARTRASGFRTRRSCR